jgi:hypothetical protein
MLLTGLFILSCSENEQEKTRVIIIGQVYDHDIRYKFGRKNELEYYVYLRGNKKIYYKYDEMDWRIIRTEDIEYILPVSEWQFKNMKKGEIWEVVTKDGYKIIDIDYKGGE